MINCGEVIQELGLCLTASCRGKNGYCPVEDRIWDTLDNALELVKDYAKRLNMIADIAYDYDGYRNPDNLMELIDELRDIALTGAPKKPVKTQAKPSVDVDT